MQTKIITCLGPGGWEKYGRRFADSFAAHWPTDIPLEIWCHDLEELPTHSRATFHSLNEVQSFQHLKQHLKGTDGPSLQYCFKAVALLSAVHPELDWIGFIDADTETMQQVEPALIAQLFDNEADLTYLYRKAVQESEGSWFAFNLQTPAGASLLSDYWGIYSTLEAFHYKKAHDNAVLDRLVILHQAHGLRVKNLAEGALGLDAFHQSPLGEYIVHYKGPNKDTIADPGMAVPSRYHMLCDVLRHSIDQTQRAVIVETGTWNGSRAIQMAEAAFAEGLDTVTYWGFDTFDAGNDRTYEGHTKPHAGYLRVSRRLENYATVMRRLGKTFHFTLIQGDSTKTLPNYANYLTNATFAYIDGGHSYETTKSDYIQLRHVPFIVFDDIIAEPEEGAPEGPRRVFNEEVTGNKRLINTGNGYLGLSQSISYGIVSGPNYKPFQNRAPIKVQPVDSVESSEQHDHIRENTAAFKLWAEPYQAHEREALLVAAGPTLASHIEEIRAKQAGGAIIFAVKHAFPILKMAGIRPDFTVILDPRPVEGISTHGIKRTDLFSNVDGSDRFLVASMTHPSVRVLLESYSPAIYGWHAMTRGTLDAKLPEFDKGLVIGGGTCAATRLPMLAFVMGFRRLTFYGYDFFYSDNVDPTTIKQQLMRVAIGKSGREFLTTGELIAAMQDLAEWNKWMVDNRLTVNFVGEGAGATIWQDTVVDYTAPKEYAF